MVIMVAVANTFIAQSKFYNVQEQLNEMQQNARGAIDLIAREIKLAGYDPLGTVISNGIPYSASQLEVLADLNGDGDTADADEDIVYSHDAANNRILRATGGTTTTLADNISGFDFTYLDGSANATTIPADIRQIQINITAKTNKLDPNYSPNGGYRTYQLTSLITPQNLCYKGGSCP